MMVRSILRPALLACAGSLFYGCSTDLDVTAPYKEITVVYSLLNKNDNIHWVKINKAFLGEGDAFAYAQIPDSTEYTEEQMPYSARWIEKVDADGNVVDTFGLNSTILTDRPEGIFCWPAHKMYYFHGDQPNGTLDANFQYRLMATAKGNHVESVTPIVNNLKFRTTVASPSQAMSLYQGQSYQAYLVRFETTLNGRRYEISYRFHYDEVYQDGSRATKYFDTFVGTVVSSDQNNQEESVAINGELFFQTVASRVSAMTADEGNVTQRIFRGIEFYGYVAAPEFHTYLQLANPISGIVEERPDYSNITGGYGLMSSRVYNIVPDEAEGGDISQRKRLEASSITQLKEGEYTGTLKFCVPTPLDVEC